MKYALLIGINYIKTSNELYGCINDITNIQNILSSKYNYSEFDILSDLSTIKPTYNNIINYLHKLVEKSTQCDEVWLHYSGHGSSVRDINGDEIDGKDEVLVPIDYAKGNLIKDDELNNILKNIKCKCICIIDACHSGTMLDLQYNYLGNIISEQTNKIINSPIIMISGCRDDQTSADTVYNNKAQGAMTGALIHVLEKRDYSVCCFDLLKQMRKYLKHNNYKQIPQISSSNKLTHISIFNQKI